MIAADLGRAALSAPVAVAADALSFLGSAFFLGWRLLPRLACA